MTKGDMRIMLETWINEFLSNGGSITICRPFDKKKRRARKTNKHAPRRSGCVTIVRKRLVGARVEIVVKRKRSKKIQKLNV